MARVSGERGRPTTLLDALIGCWQSGECTRYKVDNVGLWVEVFLPRQPDPRRFAGAALHRYRDVYAGIAGGKTMGLSIGGAKAVTGSGIKRWSTDELSVVDRPCLPSATFELRRCVMRAGTPRSAGHAPFTQELHHAVVRQGGAAPAMDPGHLLVRDESVDHGLLSGLHCRRVEGIKEAPWNEAQLVVAAPGCGQEGAKSRDEGPARCLRATPCGRRRSMRSEPVATPVPCPVPNAQETVAVAAPRARMAGVQLHATVPALAASFSPCKDRLPDVWPEA